MLCSGDLWFKSRLWHRFFSQKFMGHTRTEKTKEMVDSRTVFLKLWSMDHLRSSRSALVVLQTIQDKNSNSNELRITLQLNISEFGNDTWQSPFTFSPCTDILWHVSTDFPLYSQRQKRDLRVDLGKKKKTLPWINVHNFYIFGGRKLKFCIVI